MDTSTNLQAYVTTQSPMALASWALVAEALKDARDSDDRRRKATDKAKGAKATVTEALTLLARDLRETGQPITLGTREAGSTQHALYEAFCGYAQKSQASKMASIVVWVARDATLEPLCVAGKDEQGRTQWLGYNAAHKAIANKVEPAPRTYKDLLTDLGDLFAKADDDVKVCARKIDPAWVVAQICLYYANTEERPLGMQPANAVQAGMLEAMQRSATAEAIKHELEAA